MKIYKAMFMNMVILGTLVTATAYSWMSMWMGLEINLMSIIPILSSCKSPKSAEASLKYFITQAIASLLLLMSIILLMFLSNQLNINPKSYPIWMLNTALLIKMGAAPFHFWFPEVLNGLSWMNCLTMMTWQKIAPMIILMNSLMNTMLISFSVISSSIISVLLILNQTSMRKIMAYSSINHMAWMLASLMISTNLWTIYFSIYSLMNIGLILMFNLNTIKLINQLLSLKYSMEKMTFSILFLALAGLPPTLGFMPKWLIIQWLSSNELFILGFILILSSIATLFIYMSLMITSLTTYNWQTKQKKSNFSHNYLSMIFMMGLTISTLLSNMI
uniref:NADH-ubiquinone oxidoreductase chain 2 n=1 Tax=Anaedus unidentatus TaxID=2984367 RepID=A0A978B0K3_9CUCU|nr:NADH dehydrogenase subunit 2 [Anaedus unidentatus]UYB79069.1 NADH dehydrogenase subunit 2 [Anaedus unidentatus]